VRPRGLSCSLRLHLLNVCNEVEYYHNFPLTGLLLNPFYKKQIVSLEKLCAVLLFCCFLPVRHETDARFLYTEAGQTRTHTAREGEQTDTTKDDQPSSSAVSGTADRKFCLHDEIMYLSQSTHTRVNIIANAHFVFHNFKFPIINLLINSIVKQIRTCSS
jgi:hypothetical protein